MTAFYLRLYSLKTYKNLFRFSLTAIHLLAVSVAYAQIPIDYNDVGLIINQNSQISKNIGTYFQSERNIPEENVIYIDAPTTEEINDAEFSAIQTQIKDTLTDRNITNKLNYLVTTKGVPLRVCRDTACDQMLNYTGSASVDAEIALIAGVGEAQIGGSGALVSNYFSKNAHFSKAQWGHYIVTRLTGFTEQDVINLIDRSGPNTYVDMNTSQMVLDGVGSGNFVNSGYNLELPDVSTNLGLRGWKDTLNMDNTYVKNQDSVFCYWSWGSNHPNVDAVTAIPNNTWVKGSIAETAVSTSARTFTKPTGNWQSLIGEWISEGCTGVSGFVYEPKLFSVTHPAALFERYTRPGMDWPFNLGESYYMGSYTLGWMQVIVGDPKTSIVTEIPDVPSPQIGSIDSIHCKSSQITLTANNVIPGRRNWFKGDSASVLAVGPPYNLNHPDWLAFGNTYTPDTETQGDYAITFVNVNYVGVGVDQVNYSVEICQDVPEYTLENTFSIYPNPSNGYVTIEQFRDLENKVSIRLYNSIGVEVFSDQQNGISGRFDLDLTELPAGIYLLQLDDGYDKLIKQLVLN